MLGEVEREKLVRPDGGAKPGDAIVMTKWAGLEGDFNNSAREEGRADRGIWEGPS